MSRCPPWQRDMEGVRYKVEATCTADVCHVWCTGRRPSGCAESSVHGLRSIQRGRSFEIYGHSDANHLRYAYSEKYLFAVEPFDVSNIIPQASVIRRFCICREPCRVHYSCRVLTLLVRGWRCFNTGEDFDP